jgi:uncharacterized protein YhbP (UPF0306 family)
MRKLDTIRTLLVAQSTLLLATVDGNGDPRATPLFYLAGEGPRLYWFSSSASLHSRNAMRAGKASAAVFAETDAWRKIRGVQMRGSVTQVRETELRQTVAAQYVERFHLSAAPRLALRRATLYCLRPTWIRYLDNARRLGFRFEMELPETED